MYPDGLIYKPCHLKAKLNDPLLRVMWRSKLSWELTMVMEIASTLAPLYLHLEDDTVPFEGKQWRKDIFELIDDAATLKLNWSIIRTWPDYNKYKSKSIVLEDVGKRMGGALGILYKSKDIPALNKHLKEHYDWAPVDWLIGEYLNERSAKLLKPKRAFFKHIGIVSTKESVYTEKKKEKKFSKDFKNDFISIKSWEECLKYPPDSTMDIFLFILISLVLIILGVRVGCCCYDCCSSLDKNF